MIGDWQAITLTAKLALATTFILMLIAPPIAWWLASTQRRVAVLVEGLIALPLVLPPTVLGFYLLLLFSPENGLGQVWHEWFGVGLAFRFEGLVIASVIYSLPFAVQPLQATFERFDRNLLNVAATLGLPPYQQWLSIIMPMCRPGFIAAAVLSFAHTVGEFGVVLMIGGNIPGETRVVSIALFDHVESFNLAAAHQLAAWLLGFSFITLILVYGLMRRRRWSWR
ncbi:molybdate ABC transporter permease subunit [Echinimonas agarilytica]|uniref:Molybdenum transport system permease n=1 Tax=Echinimonas agarilytica TaxID=1215918 RepID=A0AA42B6Y8_9GAMM|nr:molybdate ABC transporter permease subunit [Echinimonas agarilytica]